jgi:membrane fusion protein, multidrug efflux system
MYPRGHLLFMQQKPQYFLPAIFSRIHLSKGMLLFLGVVLLTAVGCHSKKDKSKGDRGKGSDMLSAEAAVVKTGELSYQYQSTGNLLANEAINVYPEVAGRVTDIRFKEGSTVHKGDLLVQLNDSDIKAQIQKLNVQRRLQVITKGRQDELLAIHGISRQEYDNTVAQIAAIDADIAYNESLMRRLQIRASFDGVIGLRNISVGAIVNTTTLITIIQQVHPLKIDFPVPEQYKGVINTGEEIRFTVTGSRDTMTGKISAIQPAADASTRTIMMRALVPNPEHKLVPGAFANVYLQLSSNNNAITIPSQCIIPTTRDKKVALVRDGKVEMVTVVTGERLVGEVEILKGLQAGDTVLTTGIMQAKPGMKVKVTKVQGQAGYNPN